MALPLGADDPATETVEPREYRVWLTPRQVRPIGGVRYDVVPTYLEAEELDVYAALEVLRRPGAVACTECGADVALGPLM
ncbi:hypothetical protein N8I84_40885 [Streptomyces cynarae]|uniref:Uncharacterized protein n=1 Tax=Streptomyces cynarae TaxID=2981134 RepID=A0ABY6EJ90_9ACTN|nr:hypothetical protein [Streptomyces cynarae]UXY24313.1 hypothetical protein N8I84_40885 [Streptomyces cynarae]